MKASGLRWGIAAVYCLLVVILLEIKDFRTELTLYGSSAVMMVLSLVFLLVFLLHPVFRWVGLRSKNERGV